MDNKINVFLLYAIALLQGLVFYGSIATLYRQTQGLSVFEYRKVMLSLERKRILYNLAVITI